MLRAILENFAVFFGFVFLLFCMLDVVSILVYDRDMLLNIGSSITQRKPDFEFLNARWIVHRHRHQSPLSGSRNRGNAADAEKEEKELGFSSD